MNRWGIPEWLEKEVRERDKTCVYCGIEMVERALPSNFRKAAATWEHILDRVPSKILPRMCWMSEGVNETRSGSRTRSSSMQRRIPVSRDSP